MSVARPARRCVPRPGPSGSRRLGVRVQLGVGVQRGVGVEVDQPREISRQEDEDAYEGQIDSPRDEIEDWVEMQTEPLVQREKAIR